MIKVIGKIYDYKFHCWFLIPFLKLVKAVCVVIYQAHQPRLGYYYM